MINSNFTDVLSGWSFGYDSGFRNKREAEVRQGKNYIFAGLNQASQYFNLTILINYFHGELPQGSFKTAAKAGGYATSVFTFILTPLWTIVKTENYPWLRDKWNRHRPTILPALPETLSPHAIKICNFAAEHSSKFVRVISLVSAVSITAFFSPYFGGSILAGMLYTELDQRGAIPRRLSLYIDTYCDYMVPLGSLKYAGPLLRVLTVASLAFEVFSRYSEVILSKADAILRTGTSLMKGPSLAALLAPVKTNKDMIFQEIVTEMSRSSYWDIVIDPAHCSKAILQIGKLPEDKNFDKLLSFFDKIQWQDNYPCIRNKLIDDERFMDVLKVEFPEVAPESLQKKATFEKYLTLLAAKDKQTKEQYVARWLHEQMVYFVKSIKGEMLHPVIGSKRKLDNAIKDAPKIVAFLDALDLKKRDELVQFEDIILKLTVEGGAYCADAYERVTREIVQTIESNIEKKQLNVDIDAKTDFEKKILVALQQERSRIIDETYESFLQSYAPEEISKGKLKNDVHFFESVRLAFYYGFLPISDWDRYSFFNLADFFVWESYSGLREQMFYKYESGIRMTIKNVIQEIGEVNLAGYVRELINTNPNLDEGQKKSIIKRFLINGYDRDKLELFVLVSMGIVKKI